MANISIQTPTGLGGQAIARIVGFTCLFGFFSDMISLALPIGAGAAWRASLLQQTGDRSIVLLIGLALLIYSFWENIHLRKPFAYVAMVIGVAFLLSSILVIRDGLVLQSQTVDRISQEATQLQTQIEQGRSNPEIAASASPQDFAEALQTIDAQAETLKLNAKTSLTKASFASTSNLVIMGIGLLGLGRVGIGGVSGPAQGRSKSRKQRRASP
ncbi:MAG: HpsJ family protein [Nodosilinea sp.]